MVAIYHFFYQKHIETYADFYSYINKKEITKINACHPCMVDGLLSCWMNDTMNQSLNCRNISIGGLKMWKQVITVVEGSIYLVKTQ